MEKSVIAKYFLLSFTFLKNTNVYLNPNILLRIYKRFLYISGLKNIKKYDNFKQALQESHATAINTTSYYIIQHFIIISKFT